MSQPAGQATEPTTIQQGPLLSRSLLFGNPETYNGKLSPDGQWISFTREYRGSMNLWVKKIGDEDSKAFPVTSNESPVPLYFWTYDSRHIVFVKDNDGDENFNIYGLNLAEAAAAADTASCVRRFTHQEGVQAIIHFASRKDPSLIYIGLNGRQTAWHDVYSLHIETGKITLIRENNDRISDWYFDWNEELRIAVRTLRNGTKEVLKVEGENFTRIFDCHVLETATVSGFSADSRRLYLITNKGPEANFSRLLAIDLDTLEQQDIETDPLQRLDIGHVVFSNRTHDILYTSYQDVEDRKYWRDHDLEADYAFLQERFPGRIIDLDSYSLDERLFLVKVWSDHNAIDIYLFDGKDRSLAHQYVPKPKLKEVEDWLSPLEWITYPAADGLQIPAYLSLPAGVPAKDLPLLVHVHSGPWERFHRHFYQLTQLMANRGFAVLQPNFRGSSGFGKAFLNAGNKEWGRRMQDDLLKGVQHLVNQGIVDASRVAIMGTGYGGYATLAGLTFTPETFACGISIAGPSDLVGLIGSIPAFLEAEKLVLSERVGSVEDEEGKTALHEVSPWHHLDALRAPLLVVQGANDPRVRKTGTDKLVQRLHAMGRPVDYLVADNEGHGFAKSFNNLAMIAFLEKFLHQHCGTRYEAEMPEAIARRVEELKEAGAAALEPEEA